MAVRVILLDDDERYRRQLAERLGFIVEIEVVGQAATADEFFERLAGLAPPPDVALIDVGLPGASGIEVVERLQAGREGIGVLMLTVFEDPDKILRSIQAGASGYLLKDSAVAAIVGAIREVHAGGVPLSRTVARKILGLMGGAGSFSGRGPPVPVPGTELSPRELELLELIVGGDTEARIAERLELSPHTVRTHVKSIYRKLRVHSRAAAVRLTLERRLLERTSDDDPRSR